jgi:hypothetical protein
LAERSISVAMNGSGAIRPTYEGTVSQGLGSNWSGATLDYKPPKAAKDAHVEG